MKKLLTVLTFLSLLFFSTVVSGQEMMLKFDQVLTFDRITSVIKSSKVGYEKSYLFIGRIASMTHKTKGDQEVKNTDFMISAGDYVEVLADQSLCYDEVYLAFLYDQKIRLEITNIQADLFIPKPKNKDYTLFLRIVPIKGDIKVNAGCKLSKL